MRIQTIVILSFLLIPISGRAEEPSWTKKLDRETARWFGTTWGLGLPQTTEPLDGKINCGMFVARTLVNLGLNVDPWKLQRQPSELIIKTLAKKSDIWRYRNKKMETFVADIESKGDGWFILGLDNHVGYVRVQDGTAWFVHADYVSERVVKERLIDSPSVISSKYRVAGKIFSAPMRHWLNNGKRVKVKGNW